MTLMLISQSTRQSYELATICSRTSFEYLRSVDLRKFHSVVASRKFLALMANYLTLEMVRKIHFFWSLSTYVTM